MYQENPVGVELFSNVNAFFFSNKFAEAGHLSEYALYLQLLGSLVASSTIYI